MPSESYMDKITLMNMLILKPKLVTNYLQITSTSRLGLTTVYLLRLHTKVRRPSLSVTYWHAHLATPLTC